MGKIVRCISEDGSVFAMAIDATDIVNKAAEIFESSTVVTAAMGRLMSAASMMGYLLKNNDDSVTLRLNGDGPLRSLIAVSDSDGNVRVSPSETIIELPLNEKGKLDVGGAIGKNGTLNVIKDIGLKTPYTGSVPLINGEIAEEVTSYFATSEQVPTVCALGVLVNPDLTVKAAGGYIIQLLPFASEEVIQKVEKSIESISSVSEMINCKMTPEDICRKALSEFTVNKLDEREPEYRCNCNRQRVERTLISIGKEEIEKIAEEEKKVEVKCQFCKKDYIFTDSELKNFFKA